MGDLWPIKKLEKIGKKCANHSNTGREVSNQFPARNELLSHVTCLPANERPRSASEMSQPTVTKELIGGRNRKKKCSERRK